MTFNNSFSVMKQHAQLSVLASEML